MDNKFKSAAAKLLAQHSGKPQPKPAVKPLAPVAEQPARPELVRREPPKQNLDFIWERKPQEQSIDAPYQYDAPAVAETMPSSSVKISDYLPMILTAAIGCGLMLNIMPLPVLGFVGNAAIGLVVGVFAGMFISRFI